MCDLGPAKGVEVHQLQTGHLPSQIAVHFWVSFHRQHTASWPVSYIHTASYSANQQHTTLSNTPLQQLLPALRHPPPVLVLVLLPPVQAQSQSCVCTPS